MDEVHYLADRFRGAVWEEVIIHLPESVTLVSLSATVSNAEEFADWLVTVRGETRVVVSEHRPVPLWQHMLVGKRMFDLFHDADGGADARGAPRAAAPHPRAGPPDRGRSGPRAAAAGPAQHRAAPAGHRGAARPRGPAAGDHVHLQPGRLRRRRAAVPARRAAADRPGGADRDPRRSSRRAPRAIPSEDLDRARLLGVARRPGARPRRPPRRHAARVQGGRRGAVRARPGQGGLRHRDAGAGHQHAGPLRGAGAAGQVQRRGARRPDAGGVHPADRAGRPARHRRRGPRGRGLVARGRPAARGRAGLDPDLSAAVELPARRTTWRSTWSARSARRAARELLESSFAQFQADRSVVGLARQVQRNEETMAAHARRDGAATLGDFAEYFAHPAAHRRAGEGAGPAAARRSAGAAAVESLAAAARSAT